MRCSCGGTCSRASAYTYMYCTQLWAFSHGADNEYTEGALNYAAQLRQRF